MVRNKDRDLQKKVGSIGPRHTEPETEQENNNNIGLLLISCIERRSSLYSSFPPRCLARLSVGFFQRNHTQIAYWYQYRIPHHR